MSAPKRRPLVGFATKIVPVAERKKLLRAMLDFGIIFVLACILSSMPCVDARAAQIRCVSDRNLTLDQYLELSADHANWHMSVFTRIPKGLKVVAASKKYILTDTVQARVLPSDEAESLYNLIFNYEFRPTCRVEDPRGRWWLVQRLKDGFLTYVPASAAEVEE